ncbi:hypothetical protein [Demequina lignilytica]|uniref:Uncharacterized protein n=1 Tax=Demequina lignilytica TaxID=3051663 RepID=A0AB35MKN2_9MICO|nr:hypothetical protein [Demequina sp. SYSU T0a273]MDN4484318.1 hypothetical protein [Demequina sp. SYSU T0a273]
MTPPHLSLRRRLPGALGAALAVVLLSTVLALIPTPRDTAQAASGSLFDPGFIISDALFFDGTALTAEEIDAFIDSKNAGCAPGRVCIENYRESITAKAATSYYGCSAVAARANATAGEIIAAVGAACGISPKAILVILQKEQSLITSTAPSARAFAYAMGAGCPDTAPCDVDYAGFYEQVYYGAKLLKGYTLTNSNHYTRYQAGTTAQVAYHPNSYRTPATCGFATVDVVNQATHALYVYTPYTPNQALLDGGSDACSSYGNYNFWKLYSSWFGPTRTSDSLMTAAGTSTTYLVTPDGKYAFGAFPTAAEFSALGTVATVSSRFLDSFPLLGTVTSMVKDSVTNDYFIVDRGSKIPLDQCSGGGQGHLLRYSCGAAPAMTTAQLDAIPSERPMSNILRTTSGLVYALDADGKHAYSGSAAVLESGATWPEYATTVRDQVLSRTPLAATLIADGYAATAGDDIVFRSGSAYGAVAPELWALAGLDAAFGTPKGMPAASWLAPESTELSGLMAPEGSATAYILRSGGLMPVDVDAVADAQLDIVEADLLERLPVLSFELELPRFIRDSETSTLYWTDGSSRRSVASNADRDRIAERTGISNHTMTLPPLAIEVFPDGGRLMPPGDVVRDASTGRYWYLDGVDLRWRMPSDRAPEFTTAVIPTVAASALQGYADRGINASMGLTCSDGRWMNSAGTRYAISEDDARHLMPAIKFYPYEDSTCAAMPVGDGAATRLLTDGQGRYYYVTDGARSQITSGALRDQLITELGSPVTVSKATLRMFPIAAANLVP